MKLDVWLRPDKANGRPIKVDWATIPSVGDLVSVANCNYVGHNEFWRVDSINWASDAPTPRVDCVPAFPRRPAEHGTDC